MARMSNPRRANRKGGPELTLVSAGSEGDEELAALREMLSAAGAPREVLQALDGPGGPTEIVRQMIEAGMIPSPPEESFAGLVEGFRPLLKTGSDALDAELCGCEFLGMLRATAPDPVDVPAMLADLIGQAEAYGKPEALAMLRVLGSVGPAQIRPAATGAADRMVMGGLKDRPWVIGLGRPQPDACFGYVDFGAQEAIALTFSYGRRRHSVAVLIDHDLGGGVQDCWLTDCPDRIRVGYEQAARLGGLEFHDYQPGDARVILDQALSKPPCPVTPDQIQDVGDYLDLLRQRVSLLPGGAADSAGAEGHRAGRPAPGAPPRPDAPYIA